MLKTRSFGNRVLNFIKLIKSYQVWIQTLIYLIYVSLTWIRNKGITNYIDKHFPSNAGVVWGGGGVGVGG